MKYYPSSNNRSSNLTPEQIVHLATDARETVSALRNQGFNVNDNEVIIEVHDHNASLVGRESIQPYHGGGGSGHHERVAEWVPESKPRSHYNGYKGGRSHQGQRRGVNRSDYQAIPSDQSESCIGKCWNDYRRSLVGAALATAGTCIAGAVVGGLMLWAEYNFFASNGT